MRRGFAEGAGNGACFFHKGHVNEGAKCSVVRGPGRGGFRREPFVSDQHHPHPTLPLKGRAKAQRVGGTRFVSA
jgi:hypothetical protein